jgi:hypothetical protein
MRRTLIVTTGLIALASSVAGQVPKSDSAKSTCPDQWVECSAVGLGVATLSFGEEGVWLLGLQYTQIRSEGTVADFGLYTIPQAFGQGALVLAPQISLASTKPIGDSWLLLKGGAWGVMVAGGGGGGMLLGLQAGLGVLARVGQKSVVRLEAGPHVLIQAPTYPALVVSVGVGALRTGG